MIQDDLYRSCKQYNISDISGETKRSIAMMALSGEKKASDLATEHGINASTVRNWVSKLRRGYGLCESGGRPTVIDAKGETDIIEELRSRRKAQHTATASEFARIVEKAAKESNIRRGKNDLDVSVSKSTLKRTRECVNAAMTKGQAKTKARIEAEADPRNSYCEALMFHAFQTGIDPELIANADATQYFSPNSNDAEELLIHIEDLTDNSSITREAAESGDMGIFIKSYTMGTAAGHMAPMVVVYADDSMKEHEVSVKKFVGLSHIPDASAYGYIAFTKTRAASVEFYRWYLREVICPYFKSVRESCELGDVPAFFTTDGEYRQIEVMKEPQSVDLLEEANIIYGKHSASYSAKGNAFDAGNYFKATKYRNKYIPKAEVETYTSSLRRKLDQYLETEKNNLTKAKRDHIVDSACRLTTACQRTCNVSIIKHGFAKTGQYVDGNGFNFDIKMSCCTSEIPPTELDNMRNRFSELTDVFHQQGFITEAQLDSAGIISVEDSRAKPKDERSPHQQRAMILNTPANIERLKDYQVPEELLPVPREIYEENAQQRRKREKREMEESVAKAKEETRRIQKEIREKAKDEKKRQTKERRNQAKVLKNSSTEYNLGL
jgi:transposase-like protein